MAAPTTRLCDLAAEQGRLEDLKVLRSAGFCSGNMYLMAARGGHLEVLRWVSEMQGRSVSLYDLVNARAEAGIRHSSNVELMAWLDEKDAEQNALREAEERERAERRAEWEKKAAREREEKEKEMRAAATLREEKQKQSLRDREARAKREAERRENAEKEREKEREKAERALLKEATENDAVLNASKEEAKAKQAMADRKAVNMLAKLVKEMDGQGDPMDAHATGQVDVDPEVRDLVEHLIQITLKDSATNRLLDLIENEPAKSERLCPKKKKRALHCALRTLICSEDHPARWIAAECMKRLIQKAPRLPTDFATWLVRTDRALEFLWSTVSEDEDELPLWLSHVMEVAQPVECPWNRRDLGRLVYPMMSRAIQSQQSELILQLTRVMGVSAVRACAHHLSEETMLTPTEMMTPWQDVVTGLWVRAHFRSKMQQAAEIGGEAWETDILLSSMRNVVDRLRKSLTLPRDLVDAFKGMMEYENIALPAKQMGEAAALSLAKGERNGFLLIAGVLMKDCVFDLEDSKSFCGAILSNGHVVKVLADCLDVGYVASQADKEVLQKASDASNTLMLLNKYTDQGVPLGCDTIAELVRYAEGQNEEDERLKDSLVSLAGLLSELTKKLSKEQLIEFVEAYYTKFSGGPLTPPPSGEQGAANASAQAAQKLQKRARGFYAAFALGKRLEDAFPRSTRDPCPINIRSIAKQALILQLDGSAESVLGELGPHLKKRLDNVNVDFRAIHDTSKQDRQEHYQRIQRLTQNIRFFEYPQKKYLTAFKSIWASYSPASTLALADVGGGSPNLPALPPAPYLALPAPLVAVPMDITQDDFNTKFAERVALIEGCDRQAHVEKLP